jgi:thioredoxin-related protein
MKKYLPLFLLTSLSGCFYDRHKIVTGLEGKVLPAINLTLTDSVSAFNTNAIPAGRPFIIFYYEPHCPFCEEQTKSITKNIDELKNINIYMVSYNAYGDVEEFVKRYKLKQYQNIVVIQDRNKNLNSYFQPVGMPFLAFYDSQRRLKKAFLGAQNIDVLKDNIEN